MIWITKYRYKILRGRIAERARDLIRQICQGREVVIVRGAVSPDHIHMLLSAPPHLAPSKLVQFIPRDEEGAVVATAARRVSRVAEEVLGTAPVGARVLARRWARWMSRRSNSTLRTSGGTKTIKDSRSPRPASLEPALSRECFRRLQPHLRLSVAQESTGFSR